MKHATILIALVCALTACSGEKTPGDTYAASRPQTQDATTSTPKPATPLADPETARTPVLPPPTQNKPHDVDPHDIDTRSTDPVGTDATVTGAGEDKDAGMRDPLTPPGVPPPQGPLGAASGSGAAAATKPGSKDATPGTKSALGSMDTEFVTKAILVGLFEVQASELAVSQATTPFVREFAQMMVMDHGDANRELGQLARGKGALVPTELDQEYQSRVSTLRDQKGVDFDRQYRDMQVTAHNDAIALFDRAATKCEDADLKAYAAKLLPTLREHQRKLNEMPPTEGG